MCLGLGTGCDGRAFRPPTQPRDAVWFPTWPDIFARDGASWESQFLYRYRYVLFSDNLLPHICHYRLNRSFYTQSLWSASSNWVRRVVCDFWFSPDTSLWGILVAQQGAWYDWSDWLEAFQDHLDPVFLRLLPRRISSFFQKSFSEDLDSLASL